MSQNTDAQELVSYIALRIVHVLQLFTACFA